MHQLVRGRSFGSSWPGWGPIVSAAVGTRVGAEPVHLSVNLHVASLLAILANSIYLTLVTGTLSPSTDISTPLPGESVDLVVTTAGSLEELKSSLKVISLTDAFAPHEAQVSAGAY